MRTDICDPVRGMDLSVGAQIALIGLIGGLMMTSLGVPVWLAVILMLLMGTVTGAFIGFLSVKLKIIPMIVTLAAMTSLTGVAKSSQTAIRYTVLRTLLPISDKDI